MMRVGLFLATNLAVMLMASIIFRLLGVDQMLSGGMTTSLLYAAMFGMVTLALVQGVVNTFVIFFARMIGQVVDRTLFRGNGYGIGYFLTYYAAQIALGVLASAIVVWFSRFREFRADTAGAKLDGRENMIAALQALKAPSDEPSEMPDTLVAFGVSGGLATGMRKLFTSHPPLDERIRRLRNAA